MKRYLSVFEMMIRSSIYKVITMLLIMTITEVSIFIMCLQQTSAGILPYLEELIERSYFLNIFRIAYILITAVLVFTGMNIGSVQSYTLQRLRIKEKWIIVLQSIYNILCYLLLWAVQLGVLLIVSNSYMAYKTDAVLSNQTMFLAFHRNRFMHCMFPAYDILGWVQLSVFLFGTGIVAACFTKRQRSGKITWSLFLFAASACLCFSRGLGEQNLYLFCICWMAIALIQTMVYMGGDRHERKR